MGRIVVTNSLTLDGVMQAPARRDEDTRGGFSHGGWAAPYNDSVMGAAMAGRISQGGSMLLGRRTYEDLASVWPHMPEDNPYTKVINERRKYVVSSTLEDPLAWNNSVLLKGDAIEAVRMLRVQEPGNLSILGSGELVQSLIRADLIDEFVLLIHPLVLGEGIRLFADEGAFANLRLVDSLTTTTGVIIATYQLISPNRSS
jgi:dihydrofolate reductase